MSTWTCKDRWEPALRAPCGSQVEAVWSCLRGQVLDMALGVLMWEFLLENE